MRPSRRVLLRGASVALAASLAGCGALGSASRLGELGVTNHDTHPHTVHVLLFDGESLAHWASERVPAATDEVLGTALFEGLPTGVQPTRLLARLDDRPPSTAARFDFTAHDADCLGLQLEIGEEPSPDLSVWYTTDSAVCEPTDAG